MRLPVAKYEEQFTHAVKAQHLMAIPVGHQDALVGGDRDAVRVRDQSLTKCTNESAVAVEYDDWRIGALANV
jgi:hypothetical protein